MDLRSLAVRFADFILFSFNRWKIGVVEAQGALSQDLTLASRFSGPFSFIPRKIFRVRQFRVTLMLPHTHSGVGWIECQEESSLRRRQFLLTRCGFRDSKNPFWLLYASISLSDPAKVLGISPNHLLPRVWVLKSFVKYMCCVGAGTMKNWTQINLSVKA